MCGATGGVVTNPINMAAPYDGGFRYPGRTKFLAAMTGNAGKQAMMPASPSGNLHIPARDSLTLSTAFRKYGVSVRSASPSATGR